MRVLLVEDDKLIGSGVEDGLIEAGMTVDWAHDGRHAQLALETTPYDLVVLDLGLPRLSGVELLDWLRKRRDHTPVLVMTARDTVADRVSGLSAGADDYLGKPFDLTELIARCRALVRRSQGRGTDTIEYGDLSVDPALMTATRGNERIALTSRECALLVELLANQGRPLSRAQLQDCLYGWNEEIESNAIEVHVSNLRKKLGADLIRTIRGVGYVVEKAL
ncbi:response regulator transcription factor [Burkholderia arboris]|uniref:response regulator transcription factor n=1 Tax=Burkholderia arboris TaxID=488730 RepID=UPI001CF22D49|nr:response regulator transcription factor [Burkholderia arboris]MCA8052327.1 response regulator transcription factor [Burkholderia arboris]